MVGMRPEGAVSFAGVAKTYRAAVEGFALPQQERDRSERGVPDSLTHKKLCAARSFLWGAPKTS